MHFGLHTYSTAIQVQAGEWTQISLVYNQVTGVLIFHYIYNVDHTTSTFINVGTGCFPIGGALAVGGWQVALSGVGLPPGGVFVGEVDRLFVFDIPITPSEMVLHWQTSVRFGVGLVMGWNFNECYGKFAYDLVSRQSISLGKTGISWQISTCGISQTDIPTIKIVVGNDTHPDVDTLCSDFMMTSAMATTCGGVSMAARFYYAACFIDVMATSTSQMNNSLDSIIAFSSLCEVAGSLIDSPSQLLCNDFAERHFPVWMGTDCTKKCRFGKLDEAGTCICDDGFWGQDCETVSIVKTPYIREDFIFTYTYICETTKMIYESSLPNLSNIYHSSNMARSREKKITKIRWCDYIQNVDFKL